jgi:hypothetical protein
MSHWKALTLAAVIAFAAPVARAADGDAAPTKEVTKTVTHANGAETTVDKTMTKTQNGKNWTKDKTTTGAKGATKVSHAAGTVTHDAKGHVTRTAHKEVAGTTAKGKSYKKTVDHNAKVTKTATGKHVEKAVTKDVQTMPNH